MFVLAYLFRLVAILQVFIPDYNVSVAELVIPGADLSQHLRFVILILIYYSSLFCAHQC